VQKSRGLADGARPNLHELLGQQKEREVTDQDDHVTTDDNDGQPARNRVHESQGDEPRENEHLVGQGVHVGPERRPRVGDARDRTVEGIGDACQDENDQRSPKLSVGQEDQEHRDCDDPEEGEKIRKIQHDGAVPGITHSTRSEDSGSAEAPRGAARSLRTLPRTGDDRFPEAERMQEVDIAATRP